ncbi:heavy metal sensor histidine kinase, partial [Hydrogenophaga sp.]|uniref:heavy metal sensor histidine kinase n=1 Tax=Hydrogenophaga sp. TaxID=1904254 RepID=UPI002731E271
MTDQPRLPTLWRYLWSWVVGALLVVWTTLLIVAWYTGHHEADEITDGQLEAVARLWLSVEPDKTLSIPEPIASNRARAYVQDVAVLHWVDGQLFTDTHNLAGSLGWSNPPARGFSNRVQTTGNGEVRWRVYAAPGQGEHAADHVAVLMDMDHRVDLGRDMALKLARPALLVLPLVALLLWWALRRGLSPLVRLSRDVAALDGLGGQRLDTAHRFHEFSSTVRAINTLVDSLQAQARREREFASDVAHELRTPLTTLMGHTELALRRPRAPDALRSTLESNLEDLQRLSSIVNDMLFLARVDGGALARASAPAPLSEQARAAIEFHEAALAEAGLEARSRGEAFASFDAGLIRRALSNLLGNAIRHSAPGAPITICVGVDGDQAKIRVSNHGVEIAPEALDRIFDRFYRGQESRSGGDGRHGLGLAIVAAIAKMHGGETFARSGGGVT